MKIRSFGVSCNLIREDVDIGVDKGMIDICWCNKVPSRESSKKPTVLLKVNIDFQLKMIQNPLGDECLGISVRGLLDWIN